MAGDRARSRDDRQRCSFLRGNSAARTMAHYWRVVIRVGSLCATIAACREANSPLPPLAPRYNLVSVREAPLPAIGHRSATDSILIRTGSLTFVSHDSVIFAMTDSLILSPTSGQARSFAPKIRYSRRGDQLYLHWQEHIADTGVVDGATIRLRWLDPNSRTAFDPIIPLVYVAAPSATAVGH